MQDATLARFEQLPALERRLLEALAVIHEPLNRTNMHAWFRALDLRTERGTQISTQRIGEFLGGWVEAAFVSTVDGSAYQLSPGFGRSLREVMLARGVLAKLAELVRRVEPLRDPYSWRSSSGVLLRELMLATYFGFEPEAERSIEGYLRSSRVAEGALYQAALGLNATRAQLKRFGFSRAEAYLRHAFASACSQLVAVDEELIAFVGDAAGLIATRITALAALYLALRGDARAPALLAHADDAEHASAQCFLAIAQGEHDLAREHAERALAHTKAKKSGKLKGLSEGALWPWVVFAALSQPQRGLAFAYALEQLEIMSKRDGGRMMSLLVLRGFQHLSLTGSFVDHGAWQWLRHASDWGEPALYACLLRHADQPQSKALADVLARTSSHAESNGFRWLATELADLANREQESSFAGMYTREPAWERSLRVLEGAVAAAALDLPTDPRGVSERLAWQLLLAPDGTHQVSVRVQTQSAGGAFSSGRQTSWKKLYEQAPHATWISDDDRRVLKYIERVRDYGYSRTEALVLTERAVVALVGHPHVFEDHDCRQRVEVVHGEVCLDVEERGAELRVVVAPEACATRPIVCEKTRPGRIVVYALSPAQEKIVSALSARGLTLPLEARERLAPVLRKLVPHFAVASELAFDETQLPEVEPDARIHVQLRRREGRLSVQLAVVPLADERALEPGVGSRVVLGRRALDGEPVTVRTRRDLDEERRRLDALLAACPSLGGEAGVFEYRLDDLARCLELLCELRAMGDAIVLAWREGEPLKLTSERGVRHLRLSLRDEGHWLETDGELEVDESLKLSFHMLLALKARTRGRFVPLDDGRFLALTGELSRTLEQTAALARVSGERVALHPLALLGAVGASEIEVNAEARIAQRLERAREARALEPLLPPLGTALRPYQHEGFVWLSRLTHWGAGACLADDMGLGKTVQALALLRAQAAEGPSLVVAPTSVCSNWQEEAQKHAPDLRVKRLGSGDRARTLAELGPFDLLVCSYGVLQQERELFAGTPFRAVVLDEAQAIKNPATQRAKAVLALQAEVRVALTGTPIENHLGELWSIFNFLNPGMLGTLKAFDERFTRPVQRDGDRDASDLLKRIVAPFILRRRKSEVLADLPPKTVITLRIEPSEEERALYAALREQALLRSQVHANAAQARISLLAEITRLRRAACHPQLVAPEANLESSKLKAFEELLEELREGGHRTLVFSQFVDHLALVRKRLEALNVAYQYLDGSTPPEARAQAVRAFQAGEGEVFLISLKAGGFGLNLTAADYVVHLDPWWNPAVEDQASDRAHRIGQERPVTIYRLVMQGSIEEKMLALHAEKRDLADDVLSGAAVAGGPSVDELLELLEQASLGAEPAAPKARGGKTGRRAAWDGSAREPVANDR